MSATIIFYDGDGGGLCGHLRHRFECHILGYSSGLEVIDIYPYMHYLFDNAKIRKFEMTFDNSVLLTEIAAQCSSFEKLINQIQICEKKYILSGRHHYSELFKEYIRLKYTGEEICLLYKKMFKSLSSNWNNLLSQSTICEFSSNYKMHLGIHLRTLIDSPTGHQQWKSSRAIFYGWLEQELTYICKHQEVDMPIYLACDSNSEVQNLVKYLNKMHLTVQSKSSFVHSSLGYLFGKDLFVETNNLRYQINLCNRQAAMCSEFDWINRDSLADLYRLSQCDYILATESTYSQMAYLFGQNNKYVCFGYNRYDSMHAFIA